MKHQVLPVHNVCIYYYWAYSPTSGRQVTNTTCVCPKELRNSRRTSLRIDIVLKEIRTKLLSNTCLESYPCTNTFGDTQVQNKQTPWPESASELYRPSDSRWQSMYACMYVCMYVYVTGGPRFIRPLHCYLLDILCFAITYLLLDWRLL
jgi:hypothetical protein